MAGLDFRFSFFSLFVSHFFSAVCSHAGFAVTCLQDAKTQTCLRLKSRDFSLCDIIKCPNAGSLVRDASLWISKDKGWELQMPV